MCVFVSPRWMKKKKGLAPFDKTQSFTHTHTHKEEEEGKEERLLCMDAAPSLWVSAGALGDRHRPHTITHKRLKQARKRRNQGGGN